MTDQRSVSGYQTVSLRDGRDIGYMEYGDPDGTPLFMFHGTPACSLDSALDDPAAASGVRVLSLDRPGIGPSTFQPNRTMIDWPTDAAEVADHLAIEDFTVLGWSGGGPYALACAALLGDRVRSAGTIASICPLDWSGAAEGVPRLERFTIKLTTRAPRFAGRILNAVAKSAVKDPVKAGKRFAADLSDADKGALERGSHVWGDQRFFTGAFTQGPRGAVLDYALYGAPWGFDLGSISVPVHLWHGDDDSMVNVSHAYKLVEAIPVSQLHIVEGRGHLPVLDHAKDILATLIPA